MGNTNRLTAEEYVQKRESGQLPRGSIQLIDPQNLRELEQQRCSRCKKLSCICEAKDEIEKAISEMQQPSVILNEEKEDSLLEKIVIDNKIKSIKSRISVKKQLNNKNERIKTDKNNKKPIIKINKNNKKIKTKGNIEKFDPDHINKISKENIVEGLKKAYNK